MNITYLSIIISFAIAIVTINLFTVMMYDPLIACIKEKLHGGEKFQEIQ